MKYSRRTRQAEKTLAVCDMLITLDTRPSRQPNSPVRSLVLPLDARVSVLRPNRSLSMAAQLIIDELQRALTEYD
ncbi:hypothetical protein LYZ37_23005 (plasmid) [Vibrio tubiashii]|uniref:hypothetical protein n=1 Tax=Vibrio tubiashii TaxID=29498 RepID=UPI00234E7639|nr:hypothetical protein [Vibrio tubiashii]WCP70300.1 hypothetical protein LYZ37_23005 [Vibrio tubiashii]